MIWAIYSEPQKQINRLLNTLNLLLKGIQDKIQISYDLSFHMSGNDSVI